MRYFYIFFIIVNLIPTKQVIPQNVNHKQEVGIILINDTLFGIDGDYTGSVGAYFKLAKIPLLLKYQIDAYTPNDKYIKLKEPPKDSHPYAGFGYLGAEFKKSYNNYLLKMEIKLGATGKYSFAQNLQDGIHNSLDQSKFAGWDTQIHSRLGYVLNPTFIYILRAKHFALQPLASITVGNLINKQSVGFRMQSVNGPNSNILFVEYLLSNISKNVFLTGFSNYEYGVDITRVVSEIIIGFDIQYKSIGIVLQNNFKSKEYKTQNTNNYFTLLKLYYLF